MKFGSKLEVKRFEDRILKHEARPVETGKILFYGHSLFTRCSPITKCTDNPMLEEEVRMKDGSGAIVNHGFGTSSADDLLYYYPRMVRPYKPRALFLATASNDLGLGYYPHEIMDIEARLIDWFKADFPGAPVYCFSAIPCLLRKNETGIIVRAYDDYNSLLEEYCKSHDCTYISKAHMPFLYRHEEDIGDWTKMSLLNFVGDQTHFNSDGYRRFFDWLRDFLDQEGLL
ncbi:MAG: hypothetical protein IKM48_04875 [Clostridia bacterium]|nr:hypothetical protein [Clostridia bacterium]